MKILIVDDHPIVRRGLKQIVAESYNNSVVDEANDGQESLNRVSEGKYDIILLDISMPGMNGLDVLKDLKREKPKLPVLVLSIHPEEQYAIRALKAGASGYLNKEAAPDELISAIQVLTSGKKYISQCLADRLVEYLKVDFKRPCHELLTDREYQVMLLLASGKKSRDIANELLLSVKTISTHRTHILRKMGMGSNAELTRYALDNKLVD